MSPVIRTVAVLGAGNMGSGIAQACAQAGLEVRMRDVKEEFVARGLERIEKPLRKRVEAGKMKSEVVDGIMSRLTGTTDLKAAVEGADLVIEAVFEDMDVKKQVFKEASAFASAEAIFASNTSSLSVTEMAKVTDRPDRFGGLHYFFPAAINKLIEVVAGAETSDSTFKALHEFGRDSGKVPIRTTDSAGFAVNRFFVPWLNESVRLLEEKVANIPTIEAAAKEAFQIGMGPFELMNVTGVPISLHAETSLHEAFTDYYKPSELLRTQVAKGENWDLSGEVVDPKKEAVKERLLGVAFGIACHLVDEGVATRVDTDKGSTVGLRWAKGPFAMMNACGPKTALAHIKKLNAKWGDAFPVPASLVTLAQTDAEWDLPTVRYEVDGHVATITVDRPEALNALNAKVLRDIANAFRAADADTDVRAIILTGEGQKAFVAGADIKEMSTKTSVEARRFTLLGQRVIREVELTRCPVIVAVNGFAFGGGLELASAGDILLASDKALFGLPEVTLGIHPGFGGTQRMPRLIGRQRAKELIYTGRRFGAKEAFDMGLVLEVVPAIDLMDRARELATAIAENAPIAIELAKASVNRGVDVDLETGLAYELEAVAQTFATEDQKEGMRAFMERRKAKWQGR